MCGVPVQRQNYCNTCDELYNDDYTDYTKIIESNGESNEAMED